jgi:hypothetical protein
MKFVPVVFRVQENARTWECGSICKLHLLFQLPIEKEREREREKDGE